MRRIHRHLTFANIASGIALFVALGGGTAVALNGTNTVQSDDLGPGAQVKAPDVAANAVNGSDIVNGSVGGADIASSALPKGRKITSSCDPTDLTFVDCGTVTVSLPRPGLRVLIVATAMYSSDPPTQQMTYGTCRMGVDGSPFGPDAFPGEIEDVSGAGSQHSLSLTNVTDPNLGAGNHTFGLACNEQDGNIVFGETYVSAVVLGPG